MQHGRESLAVEVEMRGLGCASLHIFLGGPVAYLELSCPSSEVERMCSVLQWVVSGA